MFSRCTLFSFVYLPPRRVIFPDLCSMGWERVMVFFPYGKRHQKHRKMLNEYFNRENVKTTFPTKLWRPLNSSRTFSTNQKTLTTIWTGINFRQAVYLWLICTFITRFSTAVILRIDHGHDIISDDDPYLKIMSDVTYSVTHCAAPLSNIVDLLPISCVILHFPFGYSNQTKSSLIVKYLPSWFPGTYVEFLETIDSVFARAKY